MSSEPFDQPAGLGDRLDDLLLRLENWFASSRTAVGVGLVIAVAAAVLWLAQARSGHDVAIERSIPLAGTASAPPSTPGSSGTPMVGDGGPSPGGRGSPDGDPLTGPETDDPDGHVVVHIVGAVQRPGLVSLTMGDRISDAVDAAGGGRPGADLDRLNLASPVVDGMQIRVPSIDERDPEAPAEPLVRLPAVGDGSSAGGGGVVEQPVDLNRAAEAELQTLPGIGPALAARIVAWRNDNGGFASVDELESVPGIGPAKLAELRELVVV